MRQHRVNTHVGRAFRSAGQSHLETELDRAGRAYARGWCPDVTIVLQLAFSFAILRAGLRKNRLSVVLLGSRQLESGCERSLLHDASPWPPVQRRGGEPLWFTAIRPCSVVSAAPISFLPLASRSSTPPR